MTTEQSIATIALAVSRSIGDRYVKTSSAWDGASRADIATATPERGRTPSAETTTYERGARGCATYRSELATPRGVGAPRAATHRRRLASVTFDGRTYGRSPPVTTVSTLAKHVDNVSVILKSDSGVNDNSVLYARYRNQEHSE